MWLDPERLRGSFMLTLSSGVEHSSWGCESGNARLTEREVSRSVSTIMMTSSRNHHLAGKTTMYNNSPRPCIFGGFKIFYRFFIALMMWSSYVKYFAGCLSLLTSEGS